MGDGVFWGYCIGGIISGLICGAIGRIIVSSKGYDDSDNHGFAWGFWLGLIGLIVCACKPEAPRRSFGSSKGLGYSGLNGDSNNIGAPSSHNSWVCTCGARNSSHDNICNRCGKGRYASPNTSIAGNNTPSRNTSWVCECGMRNSAAHSVCLKCGKVKQESVFAIKQTSTNAEVTPSLENNTTSNIGNTAAQIKEFKKLLDEGLITEEEFAAKKKQILGI